MLSYAPLGLIPEEVIRHNGDDWGDVKSPEAA